MRAVVESVMKPPRLIALTLLACLLTGCAATLRPPEGLSDPAPVIVLDHGRHNSLVLIPAEDRVVRYALGEWAWYADRQTGLRQAFSALLIDTPSALGRAELRGTAPACWPVQVGSEIRSVLLFSAERSEVVRLVDEIDAHFLDPDLPPEFRPDLNLTFVPGPQPYRFGFNSNHQVVRWLESLGFTVSGPVAFGKLRPADPAARQILAELQSSASGPCGKLGNTQPSHKRCGQGARAQDWPSPIQASGTPPTALVRRPLSILLGEPLCWHDSALRSLARAGHSLRNAP